MGRPLDGVDPQMDEKEDIDHSRNDHENRSEEHQKVGRSEDGTNRSALCRMEDLLCNVWEEIEDDHNDRVSILWNDYRKSPCIGPWSHV